MKTPFGDGAVDLEGIRPCGLVRIRGDNILSAMVFPHASSFTGAGCHGSDVAKDGSICISPDRSAARILESLPGWGSSAVSSPFLVGQGVLHIPFISPEQLSLGYSSQEGPPVTGRGNNLSRPDRDVVWKLWVWPLRGTNS